MHRSTVGLLAQRPTVEEVETGVAVGVHAQLSADDAREAAEAGQGRPRKRGCEGSRADSWRYLHRP